MIKIFTSGTNAYNAGQDITMQIEKWQAAFGQNAIEILNTSATATELGWMVIIVYKIIR